MPLRNIYARIEARRSAPSTFHAEQARRRGSIWRTTLVCAIAAGIAGLFLSIVMLLFAPVTLGVIFGLFVRAVGSLGLEEATISLLEQISTSPHRNATIAAAAGIVILPVLLTPPLAWTWVRGLMLRADQPVWPPTLQVRPPRMGDAEEHQFGNIVAEVAIAAGLPTPETGIIDSPLPNIAIMGTAHDKAGIVATRGLLDALDRGETQMLVAQAMGSIGNGDLRVSASLLAIYRTIGMFMALLDLPARGTARHGVTSLLRGGDREAAWTEFDAQIVRGGLLRLLLWLPALMIVPAAVFWIALGQLNFGNSAVGALLPAALMLGGSIILFYGLVRVTLGVWTIAVLGWPLAWMWRSRRYLGDATAVQLAGDPQALADALIHLESVCGIPPGGERFAHLFACRPAATPWTSPLGALEPSFARRLARLRALGATADRPGSTPPAATGPNMVKLGLTGFLLFFFISNFELTLFFLAAGAGGLLLLSGGAGLLLFFAIVNA